MSLEAERTSSSIFRGVTKKTLRVRTVAERRGIGDRRNADGDHRAAEVSLLNPARSLPTPLPGKFPVSQS